MMLNFSGLLEVPLEFTSEVLHDLLNHLLIAGISSTDLLDEVIYSEVDDVPEVGQLEWLRELRIFKQACEDVQVALVVGAELNLITVETFNELLDGNDDVESLRTVLVLIEERVNVLLHPIARPALDEVEVLTIQFLTRLRAHPHRNQIQVYEVRELGVEEHLHHSVVLAFV